MSSHRQPLEPSAPSDAEAFAAPWMKVALQELGKKIAERDSASDYRRALYHALAANNPRGPSLLDWDKVDLDLSSKATDAFGPVLMESSNREIKKYLDTVRTDPERDKKRHRSYQLDAVRKAGNEWRMTAWCAAFVNWCLIQANVTHLGYATAASWKRFGIPLHHPVYGCITVVPPSDDTGSTTGHVAFYGGSVGGAIWLLGGNQHRSICWTRKARAGATFRWPAVVGDFETPRRSRTGVA
jgi:uncharacterized protein (TIGR02594 family)